MSMGKGKGKGKGRDRKGDGGGPSTEPGKPVRDVDDDPRCVICQRPDPPTDDVSEEACDKEGDLIFTKCRKCRAKFHPKCVEELLAKESQCPVCKKLLKTKTAQRQFVKNEVVVARPAPREVRRQIALAGQVGEELRRKEASWIAKQQAEEEATQKMLLAELQGGGSGASGAEVDLEQLRKEQENYEKLLAGGKTSGSEVDVDADAEFARKLAAELQASEEMAERQRMEQDKILAEELRKEEEEELARKAARQSADVVTEADMDDSLQVLGTTGGEGSKGVSWNGAAGTRKEGNGLENAVKEAQKGGSGHASGTSDDVCRSDTATSLTGRVSGARGAGNGGHRTSGKPRSSSNSRGSNGSRKRAASSASPSSEQNNGKRSNELSNSCPDAAAGLSRTDATRRRRKLTKNAGSSLREDDLSPPGSPWR